MVENRRVCRSRTPARRGSWRGRGAGGAPPDTGLLQRPAPACGRGSHAAELSCDKVTAARRRRLIRRPGGWGSLSPEHGRGAEASPGGAVRPPRPPPASACRCLFPLALHVSPRFWGPGLLPTRSEVLGVKTTVYACFFSLWERLLSSSVCLRFC